VEKKTLLDLVAGPREKGLVLLERDDVQIGVNRS